MVVLVQVLAVQPVTVMPVVVAMALVWMAAVMLAVVVIVAVPTHGCHDGANAEEAPLACNNHIRVNASACLVGSGGATWRPLVALVRFVACIGIVDSHVVDLVVTAQGDVLGAVSRRRRFWPYFRTEKEDSRRASPFARWGPAAERLTADCAARAKRAV